MALRRPAAVCARGSVWYGFRGGSCRSTSGGGSWSFVTLRPFSSDPLIGMVFAVDRAGRLSEGLQVAVSRCSLYVVLGNSEIPRKWWCLDDVGRDIWVWGES